MSITTLDLNEAGQLISDPATYQNNLWEEPFALLRREDPVHYVSESMFGPYWAVTSFEDIKAIEMNTKVFSSDAEAGGIQIQDFPPEMRVRSFFLMDPPEHLRQRAVVNVIGLPSGVAKFEDLIRRRTRDVLDNLPLEKPFNWVDRVSIEITSTLLAALMDYPFEGRRELVHWSEVMTAIPGAPGSPIQSEEEREAEKLRFANRMLELWEERAKAPPTFNLISMLAHSDVYNGMSYVEKMGILITFLVGGNDTTRHTMSGSVWALDQHPAELAKLRTDRGLVPNFVQETLRWVTPVLHMRRTALSDYNYKGQEIRKGDKVVMWYVSANRDENVIDRANEFVVDREQPAPMLTFGFGIHRCLGARVAEMQLRILWEEFLNRDLSIKVLSPPQYIYSPNLRGIDNLPVMIHQL